MFRTLKNPRGQSALEFSALIIFVMMAILIGGPYVVRSINSYFKSLEEGAIDSERETITESVPAESLPECDCNPVPACGDGATQVGGVVCDKTRRIFQNFSCVGLECYNKLLLGGQIPAPYCGDDLTNTCCADRVNAGCANDPANRYTDASGVIQRRCPNNSQRVYTELCGSPVPITNYYCVPDSTCDYQCQPLGSNASWCQPNDVLRHQNLPSRDFPVTYVAYGSSCPGTDHCEARCNSGLVPTAGGCTACGNGSCDPGELCSCLVDCGALQTLYANGCGAVSESWYMDPVFGSVAELRDCSGCPNKKCWKSPPDNDGDWNAWCDVPAGYSMAHSCVVGKKGWAYGITYCYGTHVKFFEVWIKTPCSSSCP